MIVARALAVALALAACGEKGNPVPGPQAPARADGADGAFRDRRHGLELAVRADGAELAIDLTCVGETAITIVSHVDAAPRRHLDAITVDLDGPGGPRTLRLTGDRNGSDSPLVTLAPGQGVHHQVALAAWATDPINPGGPLAPGTYRATVRYQTGPGGAWWHGTLTVAGVVVVIPAS